jgi:hypothetical protein
MVKRNYVAYDSDYNILNEGDTVIFNNANGVLQTGKITTIFANYVFPTEFPQCDEIRYSKRGLKGIEPTDVMLYIEIGEYLAPCVVSSRKTYKYFKK